MGTEHFGAGDTRERQRDDGRRKRKGDLPHHQSMSNQRAQRVEGW